MSLIKKYVSFLFLFVSVSCLDFRHISYQDLKLSFRTFSEHGITTYSKFQFDLKRGQVLVGARNALFRLSLPHLWKLEHVNWNAPYNTTNLCLTKGQSEENCHNFIKVLLLHGKKLFVCGTNSFLPTCTWRDADNLSYILERVNGIAKSPYNPLANSTALLLQNGDYYIGGPTDFSGSDFAIYRSISNLSVIRTKQYDSLWLNEPQFVGSFEHDKFIYFLFREAAVEYMNCGKIVYSRIARMCKNDTGGKVMLKDNWTTFIKARLNCSVAGDYPFYFNEIQSTSYVPDENILYATFTTPPNHIAGSAICSFNMSAINNAFSGPFKHQRHAGSAWERKPSQYKEHFECRESTHNRNLIEISKHQLMDNAVQATSLKPLFVSELERFNHLTVDVVSTKLHRSVHVMFVSTLEGLIKKFTVLSRTQETCLVEVWQAVPDVRIPILNMQYLKQQKALYVGTEKELVKIPADHCSRHVSQESCINSMDPYCGWNELEEACTSSPNGDPLTKFWKQDATSCPVLDAFVDGGWSSWSSWFPCQHHTNAYNSDSSDTCQCQTRQCNNPSPQNGGKPCPGPTIAVTNCTVHGGWTMWSNSSECSATCGFAVKMSTRTCTNPAPAHGGRVCVGQDRVQSICSNNPPCPLVKPPEQDGKWSNWGEWEECSVLCGGGFKKRHRKCDNPVPMHGGRECTGCSVQYETCNNHVCPEQRKQTPWTHWYIMGSNNSKQFMQRRFKYSCRGPVQDASQLKVTLYKEEERICRDGQCHLNGYEDKWGSWSSWGDCSVSCGGGIQRKTRICEGRDCTGSSVQTRPCNIHQCASEWACWSDWSPCNVSCGWGIKKRYRTCLGKNCEGVSSEEEACEVESCDSLLGWDNWTEWSVCDDNQEQHRKRSCRTTNPSPNMCKGKSKETRICKADYQTWGVKAETSSASAGLIIAYILLGFFMNFIMCTAFYFFYLKKRKMRIPSSPHYMSAKQNPYIAVPFQERPPKKQSGTSASSIVNNITNTLKPVKFADYENSTLKRNSHGLYNTNPKINDLGGDDKYYG